VAACESVGAVKSEVVSLSVILFPVCHELQSTKASAWDEVSNQRGRWKGTARTEVRCNNNNNNNNASALILIIPAAGSGISSI